MIWSDEERDRMIRDCVADLSAAVLSPDYGEWLLWACLFGVIGLMMGMPQ